LLLFEMTAITTAQGNCGLNKYVETLRCLAFSEIYHISRADISVLSSFSAKML